MYLLVPLSLALAAFIGIVIIVWRKMPYLRKLTPESHEVGDTILHDFAPEAIDWFRSVPWRQYLQNILGELEKLLRRIRLMMSTIDRASDTVLRTVRRAHQESARRQEQATAEHEAAKQEQAAEDDEEINLNDPEQLKQEEQRLIVAIAQNPKEVGLYSDLARVYMKMRNFADAVEALEAAAKLEPENENFQRRLESARRLAGQEPKV